MRKLSLALAAIAIAGAAVPATAQSPKKNIVETAAAAGNFDTLLSLAKKAGLAGTLADARQMRDAARKNNKVLEIGYQRLSSPLYQAAYDGILQTGVLGDIYHVRLAWHRNGSWRRKGDAPAPDYNPSQWGYPDWDHLLNWRLYWKYSQGLMAELCSHQINAANWFLGAAPDAVIASGGVSSLEDLKALKAVASSGIAGVISGRAIYDGRIDLAEALALLRD